MAGAGAKKFPAFSKLSSADVNDYLADQVIMRFATTAARDAAFGGVGEPTLAEGMTAYIDADNSIYTYDGSNWVKIVNATYPYQNPSGLELVTSCTATFAGGTAGSVSNGVITIGSANTSVTVSNAFSALYDNYKIVIIGGVGSTTSSLRLTLGATITGYYWSGYFVTYASTTVLGQRAADSNNWYAGAMSTANLNANIELRSPNLAKTTSYFENSALHLTTGDGGSNTGFLNNTTQYTAFTIAAASGTMTGGTITVYGYR
jgi:hypothetical protein